MLELYDFSKTIRDPIWNNIPMTEELYGITKTEIFMRLYNIKQLGPAELVYPGASHTRAAHSIGVYNAALKMLKILIQKGAEKWVSRSGAVSFLAAALLHDAGHFPFTHSLKELNLKEHEELTAELILQKAVSSLIEKAGGNAVQAAAIVSGEKSKDTETSFFQKILSGVLDPDKLDYLNRDAFYCGVPYGIQDTDFILSQVLPDKQNGIKIDSKAIISVESVLFSKYLMYKAVYWHKKVRIATAMMKKALFEGLEQKLFSAEALYHQDDKGIFKLLDSCKFKEKRLAEDLRKGILFNIIVEIPFNPLNKRHTELEDLKDRKNKEVLIAEKLSTFLKEKIEAEDVLIDIPEKISFESDLFIRDENTTFNKSSAIFSEDFIGTFVPALRKIRLAVSPKIYKKILKCSPDNLAEFLNLE
ncbi:HD domain-containing protein [Treponema pedis]|uniref:HD domain-containing protein n=1 Tax=Treponema pedis TaxID=409322 RepID=A0A7S7AWN5_9SPIR|nr:HD domain-containing protein [Treponema pedis]QOW60271.1 HD domain-containing protein [Treponema pedis]